jgi:hypothetical protein
MLYCGYPEDIIFVSLKKMRIAPMIIIEIFFDFQFYLHILYPLYLLERYLNDIQKLTIHLSKTSPNDILK